MVRWQNAPKPKQQVAKATDTDCPISPSGEHAWQNVVAIDGPRLIENPVTQICPLCMRAR